jgi:uncharacterized membrane protein
MAAQMTIGELVKKSWEIVKGDLAFYIVGIILVTVAGQFTGGLLMGPLMVGFIMGAQKKMKGEQAGIGDIFSLGFSKFVPALIAMIVIGLAGFIGMIILIIPGILVMFFTSLTFFVLAEKNIDGIAAIKESFALVKANWKRVLIVMIVASIVAQIGTVACIVGVLVTGPMAMVMLIIMYNEIKGGAPAAA